MPNLHLAEGDGIAVALPTGGTFLGMRLRDGIALCTTPLPADVTVADQHAADAWFCAEVRIWILLPEASPALIFARWMPGGNREPRPYMPEEAHALLAEQDELVHTAAGALVAAASVYPAWAGQADPDSPAVVSVAWTTSGAPPVIGDA